MNLIASLFGYYDAAKLLINNGAKVNQQEKSGMSPLFLGIINTYKYLIYSINIFIISFTNQSFRYC